MPALRPADAVASGPENGRERMAGGGYKPTLPQGLHLEGSFGIVRTVVVESYSGGARTAGMESYPDIVERGSWTVRETVRRPKARFFVLLSFLWLLASVGASFPFWDGWPESSSGLECLCGVVIVLELVFIVLAVVFWFSEQPRIIIREMHRNPDYDIRKCH